MSYLINLLSDYLTTGYKSSYSPRRAAEPLCEVFIYKTLPAEEQTLLEKMLASINLYPNQNCEIKIDAGIPENKMILSLNKNIKITTFHPKVLLQDASKKRPAWEDLKTFKSKIDEGK